MAIRTARSIAEELHYKLRNIEAEKAAMAGGVKKDLKSIDNLINALIEPIQEQKLRMADKLKLLSETNEAIARQINKKLSEELNQITVIKGFIVAKNLEKTILALEILKSQMKDCINIINTIDTRELA